MSEFLKDPAIFVKKECEDEVKALNLPKYSTIFPHKQRIWMSH